MLQVQYYFKTYRKKNVIYESKFYIIAEKDLGFLRIGSLNVRVKKTTEAFSNFLGVGGNSNLQYGNNSNDVNHRVLHARGSVPISAFDVIHKTWGSADNIPPVIVQIYFHKNISYNSRSNYSSM